VLVSFLTVRSRIFYSSQRGNSGPIGSIQRSILYGLSDMLALDLRRSLQVGDGSCDFQNTIVCAGTESLLLHGSFQHALAIGTQIAIGANLPGAHLSVTVDPFSGCGKAVELNLAGANHALTNLG